MPKALPLQQGKGDNKVKHGKSKSSHSYECLDSCMLRHNLKEKWRTIGSPIAFAGIQKSITITINKLAKKKSNTYYPLFQPIQDTKKQKKNKTI